MSSRGASAPGKAFLCGEYAVLSGAPAIVSAVNRRVFAIALRGHSAVAPEGSGADVAAATYGGYLCFQKRDRAPLVQPIEPPCSLACLLIWTGEPARTSDLLARVSRLAALEPKVHERCMSAMVDHATEFAEAFQSGDGRGVIRKAREYNACMSALGAAAQAPIVNAKLRRIAEWAWWHGGAAKPCGAGGGDLAVAFFPDRGAAEDFAVVCENDGLPRIQAHWGAEGVRALRESDKPLQEMSFRRTL